MEKVKKALRNFAREVDEEIDWMVIGSANLLLQGLNIQPSDIDLVTHVENLEKIEERFHDSILAGKKEFEGYTGKFHRLILEIEGFEFEIVGEKKRRYIPEVSKGQYIC